MKTSLFSVSYAGLWGQARLELPAFIDRAKALGYEGVMQIFFRGLLDGGFDGWVNYEMCSPLRGGGDEQNLDTCARRFLDYFANTIARAAESRAGRRRMVPGN